MSSSESAEIARQLSRSALRFSQIVVGPASLLPHGAPDFELRSAKANRDRLDLEFAGQGQAGHTPIGAGRRRRLGDRDAGPGEPNLPPLLRYWRARA